MLSTSDAADSSDGMLVSQHAKSAAGFVSVASETMMLESVSKLFTSDPGDSSEEMHVSHDAESAADAVSIAAMPHHRLLCQEVATS